MKDGTIVTIVAMLCVTVLAGIYDGELLYIAVGALVGLLAPSPLQDRERVKRPSESHPKPETPG